MSNEAPDTLRPIVPHTEKILAAWRGAPLCGNAWILHNEEQDQITRMCPIAAILHHAGRTDEELENLNKMDTDKVYEMYGDILEQNYGISEAFFYEIVNYTDEIAYDEDKDPDGPLVGTPQLIFEEVSRLLPERAS